MKKSLVIFLALIILISGLAYADTDGVWTLARNIRGGTFGSDEQPVTYNYSFINPVFMNRTLTINTSSGRGIWSESNTSDGIAGVTSAIGQSAIYGLAKNSNSYSGYFEGGNFVVVNGNVGIGTATPIAKLDVNGNISANNIYENGQLVATQSYVNSKIITSWRDLPYSSLAGECAYMPQRGCSGYNLPGECLPGGCSCATGWNPIFLNEANTGTYYDIKFYTCIKIS